MPPKTKENPKPKPKEQKQKNVQKVEPVKEETPEPEDKSHNPYVEVLHKRMRGLKKRLIKIEKYEENKNKGQALDSDQLKAVEKKEEVLDLIKELEEMIKHLHIVEGEEEKKAALEKKKEKEENDKKISEVKAKETHETESILNLLFILNIFGDDNVRNIFTSGQVDGFILSAEDLAKLDSVATALYGTYDPKIGFQQATKGFHDRVRKLSAKSNDKIAPGITYSAANTLIQNISKSSYFDPILAKKLADERAAKIAAEEARRREEEEMQRSYELIHETEIPINNPMSNEQMNGLPGGTPIAFMGESELLGSDFKRLPFEGSPEVVVPLPQTLFINQGFSFSSSPPLSSSSPSSSPAFFQTAPSEVPSLSSSDSSPSDPSSLTPQSPQDLMGGVGRGGRGGARGARGGRGGRPAGERGDREGRERKFENQHHARNQDPRGFQRAPRQNENRGNRGGAIAQRSNSKDQN